MVGALKARGIMYRVIGYGGTRAFRVLWMLEELGLPYEHERLMPFTGRPARAGRGDGCARWRWRREEC